MKVIKISTKSGYSFNTNKFFEFDRFSKKAGDFILIEGGFEQAHQWEQFDLSPSELKTVLKKKIVRIDAEEPNKFFVGDNPATYDHYFHRILTFCPYTAQWLNQKYHKKSQRVPIFYPFNENHIPPKTPKKYDIIYAGNIVSGEMLRDVEKISQFNYLFVSGSQHSLVTNHNVEHNEKMRLISQSKISLVHNVLWPKWHHTLNVWRIPDYKNNQAFSQLADRSKPWQLFTKKTSLVPQIKSRLFEAAFGRSLILCKRDPFNLIENFFEPDKEFVYFDDLNLVPTIEKILDNFPKYQKIIDTAFQRATKEYTTKAFFNRYLKNI